MESSNNNKNAAANLLPVHLSKPRHLAGHFLLFQPLGNDMFDRISASIFFRVLVGHKNLCLKEMQMIIALQLTHMNLM